MSKLPNFTAEVSLYKSEYIPYIVGYSEISIQLLPAQPACDRCIDRCGECWDKRCPSRTTSCGLRNYEYCRGVCYSCNDLCK